MDENDLIPDLTNPEAVEEDSNEEVDDSNEEVDEEASEEESEENEDIEEESDSDDESEEEVDEEDTDKETEETEPQVLTPQNLTAKYPKIAKDFPELIPTLRKAEEFENIFSTPQEASEAKETIEGLAKFEEALSEGDVPTILNNIHRVSPEGLGSFLDNFLPSLFSINKDVYSKVTLPAVTFLLNRINDEAETHGNKQLQLAIKHISFALFKKADLPKLPFQVNKSQKTEIKDDDKIDPKTEKLRNHFEETSAQGARDKVLPLVKNHFIPQLPKDQLTRRVYIDKLYTTAEALLNNDPLYLKTLQGLYNQVQKADFLPDKSLVDRIQKLYAQKFQQVLPIAMRKVLTEAGLKKEFKKEVKKLKPGKNVKAKEAKSDKNKLPKIASVEGDSKWLQERMN